MVTLRPRILASGGAIRSWDRLINIPNVKIALRPDRGVYQDNAAYFTAANKEFCTIAHASQTGLDLSTTDFGISVFAKRAASGAVHYIFNKYEDANNRYGLSFQADDTIAFGVLVSGSIVTLIQTTAAFASTSAFYHIVVTCDRDGTPHIYVDGVDQTLSSSTVTASNINNTGAFNVGAYDAATLFMNGAIDSLGIWTGGRLLTQAEVTWLYNSGSGRIYDDIANAADPVAVGLNDAYLKAWWDLGEADGATRADSTANNNDLTPTGAELVTNGTFTGNSTGWTEGAGWTYGANNEVATAVASPVELYRSITGGTQVGKKYVVSYDYTITVGSVKSLLGNVFGATVGVGGPATQSETITTVAAAEVGLEAVADLTGTFDNISCISKGPSRVAGVQSTFQIDDDGTPVGQWTNQVPNSTNHFTQSTISKRPTWEANIWGTNPGIQFDGVDDLLVKASAFLTGDKGAVFALVRLTAVPNAYQAILSVGDIDAAVKEISFYVREEDAVGNKISIVNNSTADAVRGSTAIGNATNYVIAFLSTGSLYRLRLLRVPESHTVSAGQDDGSFFSLLTTPDTVAIGASIRSTVANFLAAQVGPMIVMDGRYPTTREIDGIEAALTRYAAGGAL